MRWAWLTLQRYDGAGNLIYQRMVRVEWPVERGMGRLCEPLFV